MTNDERPFIVKEVMIWILLLVCLTLTYAVNPSLNYALGWDQVWMEFLFAMLSGLIVTRAYMYWRTPPKVNLKLDPIEKVSKAAGYVYLVKSSTGLWKIGMTTNPEDRIETFTVKLPFHVEYEHIIPCNNRFAAERTMHRLFRHGRKNGEWFDLSASDVAFIKAIKQL